MRPPPGAANLGGAALAESSSKQLELGVVVEYNPATHAAAIRTHSGRPLQGVPRIKAGPGDFDHLSVGTTVVITWGLGWPAILGVYDDVGATQAAIPAMSLTGVPGVGMDDPARPASAAAIYRPPSAPTDMGPGDWSRVGSMGQHVAVLEGGVVLAGSPTAQLRSIGTTGTVQTIARRVQQVTDFGTLLIENDQGRTSMILRAGASQSSETGLDEQHWTIRLDLGASGDMVDFRIVEPEGRVLFRLHAGADGRVQVHGDGGVDVSSGSRGLGETRARSAGPSRVEIGGDDEREVSGSSRTSVGGSLETTVGRAVTSAVGGDATSLVGGDRTDGVGGDLAVVVGGDLDGRVGGGRREQTTEAWEARAASIELIADGPATLRGGAQARVDGAAIVLGSSGRHPLPKFDLFLTDLAAFVGDLLAAIGNLTPSNPLGLGAAVGRMTAFAGKVATMASYVSRKARND